MNPYEILGVEKDATADVIKKAYRKLSKEHHPDVGGDSEKFKEIASAYDILSNSDKKQKYDTFGDAEASFGSNPFGGNPFDFINQFFGGASSMGRQVRKGDDILVTVKMNLMEILLGANKQITYIRERINQLIQYVSKIINADESFYSNLPILNSGKLVKLI